MSPIGTPTSVVEGSAGHATDMANPSFLTHRGILLGR
jgi:hypothetical protein